MNHQEEWHKGGEEETPLRGFRKISWAWDPVDLGTREKEELRMTLTFLPRKVVAQSICG